MKPTRATKVSIVPKQRKSAGYQLDVKRFHLPLEIVVECPACGAKSRRDLSHQDYLNFPVVDEPFTETGECPMCSEEWEVLLLLRVELTLAPSPAK